MTLRLTELYANPAYCRMAGMTIEELLSRVARRNLPAFVSQLDQLWLFVDDLEAELHEEHLQYFHWQVFVAHSQTLLSVANLYLLSSSFRKRTCRILQY